MISLGVLFLAGWLASHSVPWREEERFTSATGRVVATLTKFAVEKAEMRVIVEGKELWQAEVSVPRLGLHSLEGHVSDDGATVVLVNRDYQTEEGLTLVQADGKSKPIATGYFCAAAGISKESFWDSANDFNWGMFLETAQERLFCLWILEEDRWVGLNTQTGMVRAPSNEEVKDWNGRARSKILTRIRAMGKDPKEFAIKLAESRSHKEPEETAKGLRFLTKRKNPEDEEWIRALLKAPMLKEVYSGSISPEKIETIHLLGGSKARNLGDMLVAKWEGKWPSTRQEVTAGDYPEGEEYYYLSELALEVVLPRSPRMNDGMFQVLLIPKATHKAGDIPQLR